MKRPASLVHQPDDERQPTVVALPTCPTCRGGGEVCRIPWTSWKGRPEQNPENAECGPCPDCHGEGVRPEVVEAFEMLGQLAAMPSDHEEAA